MEDYLFMQYEHVEPFVDADRAAEFLCCSRKHSLKLARDGVIPSHILPTGNQRHTRLFRISELEAHVLTCAGRLPHSKKLEAE
jgi:hypothetical protein